LSKLQKTENANEYKKRYPLFFLDNNTEDKRYLAKRYKQAWRIAREIADILKKEYNAKKVFVFGSLIDRSRFNQWSDIDLAVSGIPPERFYAAVGSIIGFKTNFKVDLIDINDCSKSLQKVIESEGVEL